MRAGGWGIYVVLIVGALVYVFGFFGLLFSHFRVFEGKIRQQVRVVVLIRDFTSQREVHQLGEWLSSLRGVRGVYFVSRHEALRRLSRVMPDIDTSLLGYNPLNDTYELELEPSYAQADSIGLLKELISAQRIVAGVYYPEEFISQLDRLVVRVQWVLVGLSVVFGLLSILTINNTVRLAMYANRFLVKSMELVGASWVHIALPYLVRLLLQATAGLLIGGGLIAATVWAMVRMEPTIFEFIDWRLVLVTGAVVVGVVYMFVGATTLVAVVRYLCQPVEKLY